MDVPNVTRKEYQLINIDDGFLSLLLEDGSTKDDVKLPEGEVGENMQNDFDEGKELLVTVVSAMGEEHALACKSFNSLLLTWSFTDLCASFSLF